MSTLERGAEILRLAENDLRALVAEAASNGDYDNATLLVSWAQAVRNLAQTSAAGSQGLPEGQAERAHRRTPRQQAVVHGTRRVAAKPDSRKAYPQFFRRKDELVKVGWSKREKKEYQHKAPFSVLVALASALAAVGADGRVFSTDQFIPLRDTPNGSDFPTYQVYVCLALLRNLGLVEQHGRQGYSIPNISGFEETVKTAWHQLSERR